ncbi:hypothetical protein Fmac_013407 [Flemingia macrophylla]|uniref:Uncharacterized protein n=1 Tax=Flemingia macrophylla TaxID=520843 RepID=A0ABD1MT16_9FABA
MADLQQKLDALKGLVDVLKSMDDCEPHNNPTNSNTNSSNTNTNTSTLSEELAYYSNCGKQDIKGLTNQTGYVKGNANGVINFGTLTASAGAQRQA